MNQPNSHEQFAELSALAVIGQISPEEYHRLQEHLASCAACRDEYRDLEDLQLYRLPLAHQEDPPDVAQLIMVKSVGTIVNKDRRTDFGSRVWLPVSGFTRYAAAAAVLLLAVTGALGYRVFQDRRNEQAQIAASIGLTEEIQLLRAHIRDLESRRNSQHNPSNSSAPNPAPSRRSADSRLAQQNQDLQKQLAGAVEEVRKVKAQMQSESSREASLVAQLSEAEEAVRNLMEQVQRAERVRAQDVATIVDQQAQLKTAEDQLRASTDSVERERKLLTADRDIRDLMGARNLRIVDVFDVDGKGRTRRPFGRVFFTEGKSLIFYAFDLGNPRPTMQNASFQAWGYGSPNTTATRSLGIFYRDDEKSNRWVLKFTDPDVLTEIDSVFVTVEPPGGSKKPTGSKLLAAFLKANLNHP